MFVGAKAFSKKAFLLEKALAKKKAFLTQPPFPILAFYVQYVHSKGFHILRFFWGGMCGSIHNCYKAQTYHTCNIVQSQHYLYRRHVSLLSKNTV